MRAIDADELKEKLLKMQKDIANGIVSRGNSKSDMWKAAYLSIFDEYIKLLDQSPTVINDCDTNAILNAYGKGYLKGREDILSEIQLMKDYCKNDCDTTYEAYNKWMRSKEKQQMNDLYKHDYNAIDKMRKKQKMILDMPNEKTWGKVIQNLKILDQEAHAYYEEYAQILTSLLVMTAERLSTDVKHNSVEHEDKTYMWILVDKLGCYSIDGETIKYLPEYRELTALLRKVF